MKLNKKKIAWISIIFTSLAAIITIISLKLSFPFRPSIFVFSTYADPQTKSNINKKYSYKEYGSSLEFEYAISNNKAVAGICTDYSITNLILQDKLQPISKKIEKVFNIKNPWDFFTSETNDQMKYFDEYIEQNQELQTKLRSKYKDEYGDNYNFKFRDFVIPYFINDRVYSYNTHKLGINSDQIVFNDDSTIGVLNSIVDAGKNVQIQWTKNETENIVFGSELDGNFETKITKDNYSKWLNNFDEIVKKGTRAPMSEPSVNIFEPDSDVVLNNLVNPNSRIKAAVLYNGDALDAYYGNDNFSTTQDGDRIRIKRTKNNIRLLDAFVLSSNITSSLATKILTDLKDMWFNGFFWTEEELKKQIDLFGEEEIFNQDGIMRIFDYVQYTPATKVAYEYILENYFIKEDGSHDEIARDIFKVSSKDDGYNVKPIFPVDKQTLSDLVQDFQRKINSN